MIKNLDLKQLLTKNNLKSKLIRDGFEGLIIRFLHILLTFLMGIVLVRVLGVKNWGVFSYISSLIAILTIPAEFGIPILVLRETAKNIAIQNWGNIRGLWIWAFKIVTAFNLFIICISIILYFLFEKSFIQEHLLTFFWGLILVFLLSYVHLHGSQLMGMKRVILGQLPEQIIIPGVLIFLILLSSNFMKVEISPQQAMMLKVASVGITLIITIFLCKSFTPREIKNSTPGIGSKAWILSALPLAGINGIYRLNSEASLIILGLFVNPSEVGLYKVAVNFSILASFALQVINLVVAPQFASMYVKNEIKQLQKLVIISTRIILIMNVLITMILIIWGKQILSLAYGNEFVDSYHVLLILLIGQCINSATGSVGFLLNMTQKEIFVVYGISGATLINAILNFFLSPKFGMIGAAIGTSVSMIVTNIYFWIAVRKHLGINSFFIVFNNKFNKN